MHRATIKVIDTVDPKKFKTSGKWETVPAESDGTASIATFEDRATATLSFRGESRPTSPREHACPG